MEASMEVKTELQKKPGAVKKFFAGVGVGFLMMLAYLGIQAVLSVIITSVYSVMLTVGSTDVQAAQAEVTEKLMNADFLTNVTAVVTAVSAVCSVLWYFLLHGRKKTAEDKAYFKKEMISVKNFIGISLATICVYFLALLIANLVATVSPAAYEGYSNMMSLALGGNTIVVMLTTVLLAPFGEECLFRGLIQKRLGKYYSVTAVIVIQAVLFGVFHFNFIQGLYVIPIGILYGYVAYKSKSVLPCIYMHMLNNFMPYVVSVLPESLQTIWFFAIMFVICGVVVYLLVKNNQKKTDKNEVVA